MSRLRRRRSSGQRGAVSLELVLLVPSLVMLLGLAIAGARIWFARASVTEAAADAARAASLARTPGQAVSDGQQAGSASLRTGGLQCVEKSVFVDAGGFSVPVGEPAHVSTTVTCRVTFSDVVLPGMPGSMTLTADGRSALDTYRSR